MNFVFIIAIQKVRCMYLLSPLHISVRQSYKVSFHMVQYID